MILSRERKIFFSDRIRRPVKTVRTSLAVLRLATCDQFSFCVRTCCVPVHTEIEIKNKRTFYFNHWGIKFKPTLLFAWLRKRHPAFKTFFQAQYGSYEIFRVFGSGSERTIPNQSCEKRSDWMLNVHDDTIHDNNINSKHHTNTFKASQTSAFNQRTETMKFLVSLLCAVATIVACFGDVAIGDSNLKQDGPTAAMAIDASAASGKHLARQSVRNKLTSSNSVFLNENLHGHHFCRQTT